MNNFLLLTQINPFCVAYLIGIEFSLVWKQFSRGFEAVWLPFGETCVYH